MSSTRLDMKHISQDEEFSPEVKLEMPPVLKDFLLYLKVNKFLCVVHDKMWYIGMIKEVDTCNSWVEQDFSVWLIQPGCCGLSPSGHGTFRSRDISVRL